MSSARSSQGLQLMLGLHDGGWSEVPTDGQVVDLGEVFTRRWVVELILDLVGYTADRDLAAMVAIEPACGQGAFLVPIVERLAASCEAHGRSLTEAEGALRSFDLLASNVELARKAVGKGLLDSGASTSDVERLTHCWIGPADYLLDFHAREVADFVLGNPPYIRLESIPPERSAAYRQACSTMRGRSDVFVGFIEKGLRALRDDGALGFIVADRWMHNQYGAGLRQLIADHFSMEVVVSMHDVDAFDEPVSAYPAITVIRRRAQRSAVVATTTSRFDAAAAQRFSRWSRSATPVLSSPTVHAARLEEWFPSDRSWPSGDPADLALVADLERRFEPLESASTRTRVGIGVASGADDVFLTRDPDLVERSRLLPLLMTKDTSNGDARWSGTYLVNPWEDGKLVDLDRFPRLNAYLASHGERVTGRHVARRRPDRWYRTIDRIEPGLLERPKLVIPELKAFLQPVLDDGRFYPHHGLYFVTSEQWDLEVLGGLLLSDIAELFVSTHCVKMRGGCYRFQAQYLRRIRVPDPTRIDAPSMLALRDAFRARDRGAASAEARRLYGVGPLDSTRS
jgi:adenine-specific DNA-methyltransferase